MCLFSFYHSKLVNNNKQQTTKNKEQRTNKEQKTKNKQQRTCYIIYTYIHNDDFSTRWGTHSDTPPADRSMYPRSDKGHWHTHQSLCKK